MPNLEALREAVKKTVLNTSATDEDIDELINEGLATVAQEILLPDLEATEEVTTDATNSVDLPDDYSRELYGCIVADQVKQPNVVSSVALLRVREPNFETGDERGDIRHVCTRGRELIYYPIPEAPTIMTLQYYRQATPLVTDSAIPTEIPDDLQRKLLHSYACMELFDDIEDGMEGGKVNTTRHEARFVGAMLRLENRTKKGQSRATPARQNTGWI